MPILLLSGGIESATLLYERRGADGLRALFLDYGQRAARPERSAAVALCETTKTPLTILPLKGLGKTLAPPGRLAPTSRFTPVTSWQWPWPQTKRWP